MSKNIRESIVNNGTESLRKYYFQSILSVVCVVVAGITSAVLVLIIILHVSTKTNTLCCYEDWQIQVDKYDYHLTVINATLY